MSSPCTYVCLWDSKNAHFGRSLKRVFLGQLGLIKRLPTLLGREKPVLFTQNGTLSRNRAKSHFEGTCPCRPKSRFLALSNWHLWSFAGNQILLADNYGRKTVTCVFWASQDVFSPRLKGSKIAIFGILTFWSKIDDFKKPPFWAFKSLQSRSDCRKRALTAANDARNEVGGFLLRPAEVENFSKNQGPSPYLEAQKWPNLRVVEKSIWPEFGQGKCF